MKLEIFFNAYNWIKGVTFPISVHGKRLFKKKKKYKVDISPSWQITLKMPFFFLIEFTKQDKQEDPCYLCLYNHHYEYTCNKDDRNNINEPRLNLSKQRYKDHERGTKSSPSQKVQNQPHPQVHLLMVKN